MDIKKKIKALEQFKSYLHIGLFEIISSYITKKPILTNIEGGTVKIDLLNAYLLFVLVSNGWKAYKVDENLVSLRDESNDISVFCRINKGYDLGHLVEIFINKTYDFDVMNKIVIDVGASNGDSAIYFAKKGARKVIALEPFEESYKLALKNIVASHVSDKVILLNKALGVNKGFTKLYVYEKKPNANSIDLQNMAKLNDNIVTMNVETISLSDIIEMVQSENIGLLKMDCEGCEYSVLSNTSSEIFDKIETIVMEYHNGLQNLVDILKNNNYQVTVNSPSKTGGIIKAIKIRK